MQTDSMEPAREDCNYKTSDKYSRSLSIQSLLGNTDICMLLSPAVIWIDCLCNCNYHLITSQNKHVNHQTTKRLASKAVVVCGIYLSIYLSFILSVCLVQSDAYHKQM